MRAQRVAPGVQADTRRTDTEAQAAQGTLDEGIARIVALIDAGRQHEAERELIALRASHSNVSVDERLPIALRAWARTVKDVR